MLESRHRKRH